MIHHALRLFLFVVLLGTSEAGAQEPPFDLQGHRGARGLLPENTVPSFLRALDLGVMTLEMDAVVTADGEVILSHEPWMSSIICRGPDGRSVEEEAEHTYRIFEMTVAETAAFDCGARGHSSFPEQQPTAAAKPLLRDVLRIADGYAAVTGRPLPFYNVEIKSSPEGDGILHPDPETYARLVLDVLDAEAVIERATVQSFDVRALRAARILDADVALALLISNEDGFEANLDALGFVPDIYSPHYRLVDDRVVALAHAEGVAVIPWTVNTHAEMVRILGLGVDGFITDYPDVGRAAVETFTPSKP